MALPPKSRILTVPYALPLSVSFKLTFILTSFVLMSLLLFLMLRVPPVIIIAPLLRLISEILLCDMIQEMIPLSFRPHFEFFTLH
jgi:hypothetical protein